MLQQKSNIIIATSYLGNIHHFFYLLNSEGIVYDDMERYQKQTYRNRCQILGANGVQNLTIPVEAKNHTAIRDVKISYATQWQKQHWGAMLAGYNHSPYLEYYRDYFEPFYSKNYQYLWDFNMELEEVILDLLDEQIKLDFTSRIDSMEEAKDLRKYITPKKPLTDDAFTQKPYRQMLFSKGQFMPNLSIVDLLFNQGTESYLYLK